MFRPSLIHGLCAAFASTSQFTHFFQVPLLTSVSVTPLSFNLSPQIHAKLRLLLVSMSAVFFASFENEPLYKQVLGGFSDLKQVALLVEGRLYPYSWMVQRFATRIGAIRFAAKSLFSQRSSDSRELPRTCDSQF